MKTLLILLLAFVSAASAGTPKYSPVKGAEAVPLAADNAYFRTAGTAAYDYWNLSAFYVPQFNDAACSAASVAMALNALLNVRRQRGDDEKNIEQQALVEKVSGVKWKELVSEPGSEGRHGLTLAQLGQVSREALAAYGAAEFSVTVTTAAAETAQSIEAFRKALVWNERNPDDIMLLHFSQAAVTGAPGGPYPHISPVGAYDEKTHRVLIMDVDREWYEPYWAADIQVFNAMAVKTAAFGAGGYVVLKIGK